MNRLSIAAALLGALALSTLPATAEAARPNPPGGCASTTGYSKDGSYTGKLTICFTTKRTYSSGEEWNSPAVSVDAHCWHKTLLIWSEQGSCKWKGTLSMKKDGVEKWREPDWSKTTHATHRGDTEAYDLYQCRGHGTYALTLENIEMWSSNNGLSGHWERLYLKPVTHTATGC